MESKLFKVDADVIYSYSFTVEASSPKEAKEIVEQGEIPIKKNRLKKATAPLVVHTEEIEESK